MSVAENGAERKGGEGEMAVDVFIRVYCQELRKMTYSFSRGQFDDGLLLIERSVDVRRGINHCPCGAKVYIISNKSFAYE